jgi:hypothetical protein
MMLITMQISATRLPYPERHLPLRCWATARSKFLNERAAGKFHGHSHGERKDQRLDQA